MSELTVAYKFFYSNYDDNADYDENKFVAEYYKELSKRNNVDAIIASNNRLGLVYSKLRDYEKALFYFKDALEVKEKTSNNKNIRIARNTTKNRKVSGSSRPDRVEGESRVWPLGVKGLATCRRRVNRLIRESRRAPAPLGVTAPRQTSEAAGSSGTTHGGVALI
jgi:tetratricopeptide (TPR) repeat protein